MHYSCNLEYIYLTLGVSAMLLTLNMDLFEQKPLTFDMYTQIFTEMGNYECLKHVVGEGLFCARMCMSACSHMCVCVRERERE